MREPQRAGQAIATACGIVAVAFGGLAMLGWITGDQILQALFFPPITMKTNAALATICAGIALLLLSTPSPAPAPRAARVLTSVAAILGAATLTQHLFGWNLGIDQLLFREGFGEMATASPNRMGPPASLSFMLLGSAMLVLDRSARSGLPLHQPLVLTVVVVGLVPMLGYIFHVTPLYGVAKITGIALNTAVVLELLAVGILFARPHVGLARRFLADDGGGMILRRMIPVAVVLPIVLTQLRLAGERAGWYDAPFGRSLMALGCIVAFSGFIWWTASAVQRQRAARMRAEAAEREMHDRLEASLESERAAREQAERSNRLKDEFLATVSHELRTPLTAISGWAQLLMDGHLSATDVARAHEAIERNARQQAGLVNDLLDMSRMESGKLRLDFVDVDLVGVVEAAIASAAPAIDAKGLTIERTLSAFGLNVRGDGGRLQQVIGNLLSNAVKFTPRGGRILVAIGAASGSAEVLVRDTGIGISAEFLPHVFDRFRQGDASMTRSHGGLGLGLAIAQQLVQRHGGTLTASSEGEGRGAAFTVRLPIAGQAAAGLTDGREDDANEAIA